MFDWLFFASLFRKSPRPQKHTVLFSFPVLTNVADDKKRKSTQADVNGDEPKEKKPCHHRKSSRTHKQTVLFSFPLSAFPANIGDVKKRPASQSDVNGHDPMSKEKKPQKDCVLSPEDTAESWILLKELQRILLKGLSNRERNKIKPKDISAEDLNKLLYLLRPMDSAEKQEFHKTIGVQLANTCNGTNLFKGHKEKLMMWNKTWDSNSVYAARLHQQQANFGSSSCHQAISARETLQQMKTLKASLEAGSYKELMTFSSQTAEVQDDLSRRLSPPRFVWKPKMPLDLPLKCKSAAFMCFLGASGGIGDGNLIGLFSLLFEYLGYGVTFDGLAALSYEQLSRMLRASSKQHKNAFIIKTAATIFADKHKSLLPCRMEDIICIYGFSTKMGSLMLEAVHGLVVCTPCDMHVMDFSTLAGWSPKVHSDELVHLLMVWMQPKDSVVANDVIGGLSQILTCKKCDITPLLLDIMFTMAVSIGPECVNALRVIQAVIKNCAQKAAASRQRKIEREKAMKNLQETAKIMFKLK